MSAWEYDETSKRLTFQQVRLGILKRDILSIAIDEDDKYVVFGNAEPTPSAWLIITPSKSRSLSKNTSRKVFARWPCACAILAGSGDGVLSVMRREPGTCTLKFEARRLPVRER